MGLRLAEPSTVIDRRGAGSTTVPAADMAGGVGGGGGDTETETDTAAGQAVAGVDVDTAAGEVAAGTDTDTAAVEAVAGVDVDTAAGEVAAGTDTDTEAVEAVAGVDVDTAAGEVGAGAHAGGGESAGAGPLALALMAEPVDLRDDLRALAAERPALARSEAPRRLAAVASAAWRDELARNQVPTSIIEPAFESARREIWLWVGGDRNWRQVGPSLAGRVVRRGRQPMVTCQPRQPGRRTRS